MNRDEVCLTRRCLMRVLSLRLPPVSFFYRVKRMRHEGKQFRDDPTSVSMTAKQYEELDKIGFIWENLTRSWNERFDDLLKFKAEHGHCRGKSSNFMVY